MLRFEIHPAFLNKSTIEFKWDETRAQLVIFKDANEFLQDSGTIWRFDQLSMDSIQPILEASEAVYSDKEPDRRLILDGVFVQLTHRTEGIERTKKMRSPDEETPEWQLMRELFNFLNDLNLTIDCVNYLELLGEYFFEDAPFREFFEDTYRLKLFGSWNTFYDETLKEKVGFLLQQPTGILDMSNFHSIGRVMDPVFEEIKDFQNIRILVNKSSHNYLTELGFPEDRLEFISK